MMHAPLIAGCPAACNPGKFTTGMAPGKKKRNGAANRRPRFAFYFSQISKRRDQYMSSSMGGAADPFFFSGLSVIMASVVSISPATEAAF